MKSGSRRAAQQESRGNSRADVSVQPLVPTSRRASQQQIPRAERDSQGLAAPHPYAAEPTNAGTYRGPAYGRSSPQPNGNGNGLGPQGMNGVPQTNTSDSFLYGQAAGKAGTESREGTTTAGTGAQRVEQMNATAARGMGMYDREQMERVGEQEEMGGKRGFWAALCCRA